MTGEWSSLKILLVIGLAFSLLIVVALARTHYQKQDALFVSDAFGYYMYLPSIVIDGDLDLTNQIARQPGQEKHRFYQVIPRTGIPGNAFQIGCAVLWSPFFLVAHGVILLLGGLGVPATADGFGFAYELPVYVGCFVYGLIGIWYTYRLVNELWGHKTAIVATGIIVLATPLSANLWFDPGMSHLTSMSLIAMLFYYLHRIYQEHDVHWASWARIGALCGLISAVRATDVFVGIAVAWVGMACVSFVLQQGGEKKLGTVAWAVAAFVVGGVLTFLPQMLAWKALYGEFLLIPHGTNYSLGGQNILHPDILGYLFSSWRGLFSWSPALLVATVGYCIGVWKKQPMLTYAFLVLAAAIYFVSTTNAWWAGYSFGTRRMVDYSVIFAMGLAYLLSFRPTVVGRYWFRGIMLLFIGFNWVLMARYYTHDLPEYGYVSWSNLIVGTLVYPVRPLTALLTQGAT